jgi:hypothetical protein
MGKLFWGGLVSVGANGWFCCRMLSSITNVTGGPQWDETQGTTQTTTQTHS